jgi:hypothetical protein
VIRHAIFTLLGYPFFLCVLEAAISFRSFVVIAFLRLPLLDKPSRSLVDYRRPLTNLYNTDGAYGWCVRGLINGRDSVCGSRLSVDSPPMEGGVTRSPVRNGACITAHAHPDRRQPLINLIVHTVGLTMLGNILWQ